MQGSVRVAVVGATGVVGKEILSILAERQFPVSAIRALASSRSAGRTVLFGDQSVTVEAVDADSFAGIDIALFSAGASVSRNYASIAAKTGAVVIDNSSAFRSDPAIPLVIPEVNGENAFQHKGIIANPNCSTIQMLLALAPIHRAVGIDRIVVCTYQSVSGKGHRAMEELTQQQAGGGQVEEFPYRIAANLIPDWGAFEEDGSTEEEAKMVRETAKILDDDSIRVAVTTVRVPVFRAHSEAIHLTTRKPISPQQVRELLAGSPGIVVQDGTDYITPLQAEGTDPVYVGRIRQDRSVDNGLAMWVVSDNLRKGAALNAVQIAELLIQGRQ